MTEENVLTYELMIVTDPNLGEEKTKEEVEKIKKLIKDFGGTITHEDFWGLRNLAYKIKKQDKGYYVVLNFELPREQAKELNGELLLEQSILRYLLIKTPKYYKVKTFVELQEEFEKFKQQKKKEREGEVEEQSKEKEAIPREKIIKKEEPKVEKKPEPVVKEVEPEEEPVMGEVQPEKESEEEVEAEKEPEEEKEEPEEKLEKKSEPKKETATKEKLPPIKLSDKSDLDDVDAKLKSIIDDPDISL